MEDPNDFLLAVRCTRFFASGPSGSFFTDSYEFAEKLIKAVGEDRDDWTITDLDSPIMLREEQ